MLREEEGCDARDAAIYGFGFALRYLGFALSYLGFALCTYALYLHT